MFVKQLLLKSKTKFVHNVNLDKFKKLDKKKKLNQFSFFKAIGFKNVDTLDFSDYEGANIIFDLNNNITPIDHLNKYDLIYDGGTLEHVFNIGNAMNHLNRMTRKNGVIFHSNPCNGYIDHGFFQISPTLYFDYYLTNDYKILCANILDKSIGRKYFSVKQDLYRTLDVNFGPKFSPKGVLNFCAQKLSVKDNITIPQQGFYISKWKKGKQKYYQVETIFYLRYLNKLRSIFELWLRLPFYLIETLKSIKRGNHEK